MISGTCQFLTMLGRTRLGVSSLSVYNGLVTKGFVECPTGRVDTDNVDPSAPVVYNFFRGRGVSCAGEEVLDVAVAVDTLSVGLMIFEVFRSPTKQDANTCGAP